MYVTAILVSYRMAASMRKSCIVYGATPTQAHGLYRRVHTLWNSDMPFPLDELLMHPLVPNPCKNTAAHIEVVLLISLAV